MEHDVSPGDVIVPGEKVYLGQIQRELAPTYRRWLNDLHVSSRLGLIREQIFPLTNELEEDWYEQTRKERSAASFTIYERETGRAVGNLGLMGIDHPDRNAELGIAIGESWARGKGYGTEAVRLVLDYGFTVLGLHRIWLECVAFNEPALRAYRRAGFKEVGRGREAWQVGGQRHDLIIMDILASEFESPVLAEMLGIPGNAGA